VPLEESSALRFILSISSQIEHQNFSVLESLDLERVFFADSRAVACF
jgi:hypothetical protein